MRTLEGGNVHRQMMMLAKAILEKQGYTVLLRVQVGDAQPLGIIDVLGIKDGEKVAVECQILPNSTVMQHKLEAYKPHITKLMLAIPRNVTPHNIPAEIEILKLDIDKPAAKGVKLFLVLSVEAAGLLRAQGDVNRVVEELILAKFAPKPAPIMAQPVTS